MTSPQRRPIGFAQRVRLAGWALALAFGLALAGCQGKPEFRNTDVTGADFASDFSLTGHDGKPRTLADFRGKAVVIFFGYTQCPDVCPTTLAELAEVMKQLGPDADRVQVLFVSVDPERDTQELLAHYVPAFDPRFLGLYGDAEATARTAKAFRVFYQKVPGKTPDSYTVDHTAGSYVYDTQGKLRLFIKHGTGPEPIVHDLRLLLKEAS
ncbi:MAG TPA: SCO family protein [Burkholderiaceae bacterium]|nr:SCO family protein [Burkholderiaceae bacterium]